MIVRLYFRAAGALGPAPREWGEGLHGGSEIEPLETVARRDRPRLGETARSPRSRSCAGLIALGRERGYLTFEQIAATLEEVEITKEQVSQLHAHLVEHGVDVIAEDGVSAYKAQRETGASGRPKRKSST